ncbi:Ribosomal rna adenine dimethylase, putative [Candida maltosa Xu316]|uniref:rRNA adenine N(6)-methyltransferase n=1 Tax=Candida maltosa (strain Xu316) TaxID=1245528 RepID=M3JFC2_CANMX|nr:Ribosomal rna adenine dimethylase, putative [Candida maltosa Xu316]
MSRIASTAKSFNPVLNNVFEKTVKYSYGRTHLRDPEACQKIIDKLDLTHHYKPNNFNIIDVNPGYGLLSSMLNYELKPKNHILIEDKDKCVSTLTGMIDELQNKSNNDSFELYKKDAYEWETYSDLIDKDKLISPIVQPYEKVNDDLLIVANWTGMRDESIIAQWVGCCGNRNWLMKYGKVRMVIFVPALSAMKFITEPGFRKRRRTGMKFSLFTDSKLVAITEAAEKTISEDYKIEDKESDEEKSLRGSSSNGGLKIPVGLGYDPRVLVRDQPPVITKAQYFRNADFAVIEVIPGDHTSNEIANIEYFMSSIYVTSAPLKSSITGVAPGAEYLLKLIPKDILEKKSYELTNEDILEIARAYEEWPFKPSLEDSYMGDFTQTEAYF